MGPFDAIFGLSMVKDYFDEQKAKKDEKREEDLYNKSSNHKSIKETHGGNL